MSHTQKNEGGNKKYYTVFSGSFRTRVQEGTPGALDRINKKGNQVFEEEHKAIFGKVENVYFEDSDFGKQLKIELDADENGKTPVLSFGAESKDGRDVMKKLPAIDFSKEVRVMPYRFEGDDGKEVSGIAIHQADEEGKYTVKIENFFFDPATKKHINGYPTIDWDNTSESEQKKYKIDRDDFLQNYIQNKVVPGFDKEFNKMPVSEDYPPNTFDDSEMPF